MPQYTIMGGREPPKSKTTSTELEEYYSEQREPLLHVGWPMTESAVTSLAQDDALRPRSNEADALAIQTGRQSKRNWIFTLVMSLTRSVQIIGTTVKAGLAEWKEMPLTGDELKAAAKRVFESDDYWTADNAVQILAQARSPELMFALEVGARPAQHANTLLLIDVVAEVVSAPLYELKRRFDVPRPVELIENTSALLPNPGHASFPGGHATIAYALASVVGQVTNATPEYAARLTALAKLLATNRERAGLHTSSDTAAGKMLGEMLGVWMLKEAVNSEGAWEALVQAAKSEWV